MKKTRAQKEFYFFLGTTAEFIKVVPVAMALGKRGVEYKIICSGQNTVNMAEIERVFGKVSVYKAFTQKDSLSNKSIFAFIVWTLKTLISSLLALRPDFMGKGKKIVLIVHGDTVSSLIGALVGKIYGVCVAHVESGLRSNDFMQPFPEELCRYLVSKIADVHYAPNSWAIGNLIDDEGLKIDTRNNVVYESMHLALNTKQMSKPLAIGKYFLLMLHRQEHLFFKKSKTIEALNLVIKNTPKGFKCVLIMHKLTEEFLRRNDLYDQVVSDKRVKILSRQKYPEFVRLMKNCEFMVSDGGSTQEEAYYLGKPCLIMRNKTERIEGLGKNAVMANFDEKVIENFMKNYKKYSRKPVSVKTSPSSIIVNSLLKI